MVTFKYDSQITSAKYRSIEDLVTGIVAIEDDKELGVLVSKRAKNIYTNKSVYSIYFVTDESDLVDDRIKTILIEEYRRLFPKANICRSVDFHEDTVTDVEFTLKYFDIVFLTSAVMLSYKAHKKFKSIVSTLGILKSVELGIDLITNKTSNELQKIGYDIMRKCYLVLGYNTLDACNEASQYYKV